MSNCLITNCLKAFPVSLGIALVAVCPARAECYGPLVRLPASVLNSFNSTPMDVLALNKEQLSSRVRDLVTSSAPTLQVIASLLKESNAEQTTAIGIGLAQAAIICVRTDQQFAAEIQVAVAASGNLALNEAVSSSIGDKPIATVRARAKRSIHKWIQHASIEEPLSPRKYDRRGSSAR